MIKKILLPLSLPLNVLFIGGLAIAVPKVISVADGFSAVLSDFMERRMDAIEASQVDRADIVFLGDSITHEGAWDEYFPDHIAVNRGIGGDTVEQVIERLGDRLTHDPFLSASKHNVVTSVTAIQSSSAILSQGGDIEPEWQARFHRNIFEDSQRLTEATEGLVKYLDGDEGDAPGGSLPQDDLDRWLASLAWRVDVVEEGGADAIPDLVTEAEMLSTRAARRLAQTYLERYAADAAVLPLDRLVSDLAAGASPSAVAQHAGIGLPVVFRRLAVLRTDETPDGEVYGLVACDASGTLTYRKPLAGVDLPRYSAACPFWPLFTALQRPMTPVTDTLSMSGREEARFHVQAFAEVSYPSGFDGPSVTKAWMLIRSHLGEESRTTTVGTSCRICPEATGVGRREPSVFI